VRRLIGRKRIVVPAVVVAVMLISTVAYAAWSATGSGSANASAANAQGLSISSPVAASGLYPTGSVNVSVQFSNPNSYAVTVTSVAQTSGQSITVDGAHSGCNASSVSFDNTAGASLSVRVPANSTASTTLSNAVSMSNAAVDACQGATFSVPLTLTGASSS
jgi:hypothetical protein